MGYRRILLTIIAMMIVVPSMVGQIVNTTLSGTVKDPSGGVIPGATVKLIDAATKVETTTLTDNVGYYIFTNVKAGYYVVVTEVPGFKKAEVVDVKVDVATPARVNVQLEMGGTGETVTVSSSAAQAVLHLEGAELQTTISQRQIVELPLNGRNPMQLAQLQAGVATAGTGARGGSVNGLRGSFVTLKWDGIPVKDPLIPSDSFFAISAPNADSISEFSVATQNTGPEAGIGVSHVKMVTPRGGNSYHGNLFWYHRNDVFAANSFFNNAARDTFTKKAVEKPKLIRNQFGGVVGGPIIKDKLFFYSNYEAFVERVGASVSRTVLTPLARQGRFTYPRRDNGQLQTVDLFSDAMLLPARRGRVFPDPLMRDLIARTPSPNDPTQGDGFTTGGFRWNTSDNSDSHTIGLRLDYEPFRQHKFEFSTSYFHQNVPNQGAAGIGAPFPGGVGAGQKSNRIRPAVAWFYTPTSNLTSELRYGYSHYNVDFVTKERFERRFIIELSNPDVTRRTSIISNPIQNFLPQGRKGKTDIVTNNWTWVKSKHQFRFGGEISPIRVDPYNDGGILPVYNLGFTSAPPNTNPINVAGYPGGISTADANRAIDLMAILMGSVGEATQTFRQTNRGSGFLPARERLRFDYYTGNLYVSDRWRITPNLNLDLGLSWLYVSIPNNPDGLLAMPRNRPDSLLDPNAVIDYVGKGTNYRVANPDRNNFAPNVGIAWDPFGTGKTSVRAGYMISYTTENIITAIHNLMRSTPAVAQTQINRNPGGTVGGTVTARLVPRDVRLPITAADNTAINPTNALFALDANVRVPYVQQWNLSLEREIFKDTVVQASYVANHAIKLLRGIDRVQIRVKDNGFLDEFRRAQSNLLQFNHPCGTGGSLACSRTLPLFTSLRIPIGGFVTDFIRDGRVGDLAAQAVAQGWGPRSFYLMNPNAFAADLVGNFSFSNYNALQLEVRRRLSAGLFFQANYTWAKAFTDFNETQSLFEGYLDNELGAKGDKRRTELDIRHAFKFNSLYELPIGPGKRFFNNTSGPIAKLIGGWQASTILYRRSGLPFTILSALGTLNRAGSGRALLNPASTTTALDGDSLSGSGGAFRCPWGISMVDCRLVEIGPNGRPTRANPQFFTNPAAGTYGNAGNTSLSGPGFFQLDLGAIKRTKISENLNVEFRAELFNLLNNVNFAIPGERVSPAAVSARYNINERDFGRISSTFGARVVQFAMKFNF